MPTGTWERLPEAKRAAVIAAAQDEVLRAGFHGASLNTIAREAGVSKGSLFQYFEDKADLCTYLSDLTARRVRAAVEAYLATAPEQDVHQLFGGLTDVWVRYFFEHPADLAMTTAAHFGVDPTVRPEVRHAVNRHFVAVLRPLLSGLVADGRLGSRTDVDALATLLALTYTHLALAPHAAGVDLLLGLDGTDAEQACATARRLVAVVVSSHA